MVSVSFALMKEDLINFSILRGDRIPDIYTYCVSYSFGRVSFGSAIATFNGDKEDGCGCRIDEGEEDVIFEMGLIFENYKKMMEELFENVRFNFFVEDIVNEINEGVLKRTELTNQPSNKFRHLLVAHPNFCYSRTQPN